jgi:hypothetical protein
VFHQANLGAFDFPFSLAKSANLAEAALLAIDPLEKDDEQEIESQGAECQENGEWRHNGNATSNKSVGGAGKESTEEVVGKL